MTKSIITDDFSRCFICGRTDNLTIHHVFEGNPQRKYSDKYHLVVPLCITCHGLDGTYGLLHNPPHAIDIYLKKIAQERFEMIYGHEAYMKLFLRNYL